jgi:hypothetical protein
MPLAQMPAPTFDDLLLELPRRDQPPLRPQAVGEVEHGCEGFGVILAERQAPFRDQALLRLAWAIGIAHRSGANPT